MDQHVYDLFAKKLLGTISPNEDQELAQMCNDPKVNAEYKGLKQQWELSGHMKLAYQVNEEKAWQEFVLLKTLNKKHANVTWQWLSGIAAMLVMAMFLTLMLSNRSEVVTYATIDDEIFDLILPDSSHILLNERSKLTYTQRIGSNDRQVTLSGEAFFEVKREESRPFKIKTGETLTEVLGTSFNIRGYENESRVLVKVIHGKVSFSVNDNELILTKEMAASYDIGNGSLDNTAIDVNQLSWMTKELTFKNQPLKDVIKTLETYFEVTIVLQNESLGNCLFTGRFTQLKIENVLEVISISLNLQIEKINKKYIFKGDGCSN